MNRPNRSCDAAGPQQEIVRSYYSRGAPARLALLATHLNRTEATLLGEALDELIQKQR